MLWLWIAGLIVSAVFLIGAIRTTESLSGLLSMILFSCLIGINIQLIVVYFK